MGTDSVTETNADGARPYRGLAPDERRAQRRARLIDAAIETQGVWIVELAELEFGICDDDAAANSFCLGAVVDVEQPGRVDAGVDLRCRQAGMAQQFLDGAQIATRAQQMRCKGMAQRMWCRRLGQPQRAPQPRDQQLNVPRIQFDALKAELHNCVQQGWVSQRPGNVVDYRAHLLGRIGWVMQVNPQRGAKLRGLFERIDW